MGCCGGGYQPNNRKTKEWESKDNQDSSSTKLNPMLIVFGLLLLGLVIYNFLV